MKYLGAFTALGVTYPEYVSINQKDDGTVTIDAREKSKDNQSGSQVHIEIPTVLFALLVQDLSKNFHI